MHHLEIFQKFRKHVPDCLIDGCRSLAAAYHHDDRFRGIESAQPVGRFFIPRRELLPDGGTRQNRLIRGKLLQCLRKITAHLLRHRNTELIRKAGGHVRFMYDTRNSQCISGPNHRNADKPSLGKDHVRLLFFQVLSCLTHSLDHTEGIGEILGIKISSEFPCGNAIIGNVEILH